MRRNFRRLVVFLGVFLVLQGASCARGNRPEPGVRLTPCRIDGFPEEIKCTSVSVPESRTGASDRRVSIHVAIVPALARVAASDPLVLLAGGPGQAASSFGPWIASVFAPIRRHRDILLIDQRGTGQSQPLRCRADESSTGPPVLEREEKASRECLASLDGDPRYYANGPAMEDLDEIRAALGYTQLNLWGGSYGTRAALVYMRTHPDRVRSAVLDGVAPWSLRFPLHTARDGERALVRLLDIDDATRGTTVGPAEVALWKASCAPWPRATLPPDASAPVRFDGPVLLLSGDLDPVVPPQWAEEARATMPRARHVIAPGVGHNVTPIGCAPELVAAFIERADAMSLDPGCLNELRRPPFVTSPAGWRP